MKYFQTPQHFNFLFVLAFHTSVHAALVPECTNYTLLTMHDRSSTYHDYYVMKCDVSKPKGWYRFSGQAGTHMSTTCIKKYHCGTEYPGWLRGNHPSIQDGNVTRTVCFTKDDDNCCYWSVNVTVRNCSGFYVYGIDQVPGHCPFRFCGNGLKG